MADPTADVPKLHWDAVISNGIIGVRPFEVIVVDEDHVEKKLVRRPGGERVLKAIEHAYTYLRNLEPGTTIEFDL